MYFFTFVDIFQVAANRFPSSSRPSSHSDCIVFEDSPHGITAAEAAGMQASL